MDSGSIMGGGFKRLVAQKTVRPTNFVCLAPDARNVSVVGDFNEWKPGVNPMARHFDGSWHAQIPLKHGHHQYAFCVDGTISLDPRAQGTGRNGRGERVSLLAVS